MKIFEVHNLFAEYARLSRKWCMIISWDIDKPEDVDELFKAAPYLGLEDLQILYDGQALLTFESENEMWEYYNQTVGDDGPTKTNPYLGPFKVYALTISPEGQFQNENT